ncbi:Homeodomain-like protein [Radiomyces spectabilis]|uniref:Homeodomain-like protein n=1 Tax=Radiomyces spectabilis TaxID=64574 RepID=UPI00221E3B8F|nr:Homeodomain-like protein [Radiomyces spectabilis]KAI8377884.1 Homeodomain-like protein [Radiomyces spectabilis]
MMISATNSCTLPPISDLFLASRYTSEMSRSSCTKMYDGTSHYAPSMERASFLCSASDQHQPLKAKRKRASPSQLSVLNRVFSQTYFPSTEMRVELGKQLGMSPRTVQIWFQNRRQSLRTRGRSQAQAQVSPSHSPLYGRCTDTMYTSTAAYHSPPLTPPTVNFSIPHLPPLSSCPSTHQRPERISLPPLRLPPVSAFPPSPASMTSSFPSPTSPDTILFRD